MASEPRGCLAVLFGGGTKAAAPPKAAASLYARNERFLSPAEASFLGALRLAVAEQYEIFAKVRLLDLVRVKSEVGRQAAFNRVQSKHVDFLLCERGTYRPLVAIELDDSTHQRSDRQARDAFLEQVLEEIGLPPLRFSVTRAYDPREIARLIQATLQA